jgi:hypothetical protein
MPTRTPIDQVIRQEQFERDHPEVTFAYADGAHRATVRRDGTVHEVAERELRPLLDRVETIVEGAA